MTEEEYGFYLNYQDTKENKRAVNFGFGGKRKTRRPTAKRPKPTRCIRRRKSHTKKSHRRRR